ncbi:fimbria/pilus outer membrane usher protein [Vagococcus sp. WN89Y]|uniref:fimbria/pilus outer membrane usher protein n=1 Tax=Vagococcus sp. WN89Y TaxID=3457258 RepID=UPI003FCC4766
MRLSRNVHHFFALVATQGMIANAGAEDVYFDPAAIEFPNTASRSAVDLTIFEQQGKQLPGTYLVDIAVNNDPKGSQSITFVTMGDTLQPLLTPAQLASWGILIDRIPGLQNLPKDVALSQPLANYVPDAKTVFEFAIQKLYISVPQLYMNKNLRGLVDSSRWLDGLPVFFSTYGLSGAHTKNEGAAGTNSLFLSLNNGLNLGKWRLRNTGSGSWDRQKVNGEEKIIRHWNNNETVLLRDIASWESRLAIGQMHTPSDVFDSVSFTGAQLATEDGMWPDNMRSFAPVIRGIAASSAKVAVRQNDSLIYETWVPAGPFEITDLPPGGGNGDLEVSVTEDNGRTTRFTVAYSSLAVLLREGQYRYAFSAGQYRQYGQGDEPEFGQFSLMYGFPGNITGYGGSQLASNYQSFALGTGIDIGKWGALSSDVTVVRTKRDNQSHQQGQSYRLQYSKNMLETGSTLTLAAYRYSTRDYYTFSEYVNYRESPYLQDYRRKSRWQVNIQQRMPGDNWGSLYLTWFRENYWRSTGNEDHFSSGYSNNWQGIGYNLNYTHSRRPYSGDDHQFALSVNVPLSRFLPSSWASYSVNTGSDGYANHQVGIFGSALENNQLSYSVSQSYGTKGVGYSGNASVGYTGAYGDINGGYNYSHKTQRLNYGVRGGVMLHPWGLTLAQPISGQMTPAALVRIPGEAGIQVNNSTTSTDWRGYTVVPSLMAYRNNTISINTQSLSDDVAIPYSMVQLVPDAGAVVLAEFTAFRGKRALVQLKTINGSYVPFGAMVTVNGEENNASIVGDNGEVYLTGLTTDGTLTAKWGNGSSKNCTTPYSLADKKDASVYQFNLQCR